MSRDFIGSEAGRSFKKSPNRDRVTRAPAVSRLLPQINYIHTAIGFFDNCLVNGAANGVRRYRRCRLTVTNNTTGARRIDLVDTGNGYQQPSYTNLLNETGVDYPVPAIVFQQATSPTGFRTVFQQYTLTAGLEDPEEEFGTTMIAQSYADVAGLTPETATPGSGADTTTYNQTYYVRGPGQCYTTARVVDGQTLVVLQDSQAQRFQYTATGLRFNCWRSAVQYSFDAQPNEGTRAEAKFVWPHLPSIAFVPEVVISGNGRFIIPYLMVRLSKMDIRRSGTNLWTTTIPNDAFFQFTGMTAGSRGQLACAANVSVAGGILNPPAQSLVTEFKTNLAGIMSTPIPPFIKDPFGAQPTCF